MKIKKENPFRTRTVREFFKWLYRNGRRKTDVPFWAKADTETVIGIINWLIRGDLSLSYSAGAMNFIDVFQIALPCSLLELKELVNFLRLSLTPDYENLSNIERQLLANFLKVRPEIARTVSSSNLAILGMENFG